MKNAIVDKPGARMIEGVPYYPFIVRFTVVSNGRKRQCMYRLWSPGEPWIREEIARKLDNIDNVQPNSVRVEAL